MCSGDHGAEFLVGPMAVNEKDNVPFNPSLALIRVLSGQKLYPNKMIFSAYSACSAVKNLSRSVECRS